MINPVHGCSQGAAVHQDCNCGLRHLIVAAVAFAVIAAAVAGIVLTATGHWSIGIPLFVVSAMLVGPVLKFSALFCIMDNMNM